MMKLIASIPFLLSSLLGGLVMFLIITGALPMGVAAEIAEFSLGFMLFVFGLYATVKNLIETTTNE
jgi:hypothetical protein